MRKPKLTHENFEAIASTYENFEALINAYGFEAVMDLDVEPESSNPQFAQWMREEMDETKNILFYFPDGQPFLPTPEFFRDISMKDVIAILEKEQCEPGYMIINAYLDPDLSFGEVFHEEGVPPFRILFLKDGKFTLQRFYDRHHPPEEEDEYGFPSWDEEEAEEV